MNQQEENARKAEQCDQAVTAYEQELSATNHARRRYDLGQMIKHERETAAFYRGRANDLQSEA